MESSQITAAGPDCGAPVAAPVGAEPDPTAGRQAQVAGRRYILKGWAGVATHEAFLAAARRPTPLEYSPFQETAVRRLCLIACFLSLMTACASPLFDVGKTETVLPLSRAYVDGKIVEYITTDISDLAMATMMGANHVPSLAAAINAAPGRSFVERVYKFANEEQISIFQSAPNPAGSENRDRSYSPLWRVVMVRWNDRAPRRELKSEEALLAAEERKEVALEVTDIIVNCPVTRSAGGQTLKGVR